MKSLNINQNMLDAIVSGVVAKISGQITDALTGGPSPSVVAVEASQPATGKRAARPRRRANAVHAAYRLAASGKAAGKLADTMPDRIQPAYRAMLAAGKSGLTINALMTATKRTSKQLENDVHWLKVNGLAIKN